MGVASVSPMPMAVMPTADASVGVANGSVLLTIAIETVDRNAKNESEKSIASQTSSLGNQTNGWSGVYYVLVRGFTGPAGGSRIRLLAETLPLVITDVKSDRGGDGKFVTTTISGAQFAPQAILKLVRPDIAEFEPLDWKV